MRFYRLTMSEVAKLPEAGGFLRNKKSPHKKGGHKGKKKGKVFQSSGEKGKKIDGRMRKLYQKRAREYNSDDEDDEGNYKNNNKKKPYVSGRQQKPKFVREQKKPSEPDNLTEEPLSDDEDEDVEAEAEALPGIMKFAEGVRAFKTAFKSIIKKSVPDDSLVSL